MAELGKRRRWRTALAMALWGIGSGAGAASGPDPFPFVAGDRWTWEVIQSTGAGSRILGHTHDPATSELIETWQLEIGERDADARRRSVWPRGVLDGDRTNGIVRDVGKVRRHTGSHRPVQIDDERERIGLAGHVGHRLARLDDERGHLLTD